MKYRLKPGLLLDANFEYQGGIHYAGLIKHLLSEPFDVEAHGNLIRVPVGRGQFQVISPDWVEPVPNYINFFKNL